MAETKMPTDATAEAKPPEAGAEEAKAPGRRRITRRKAVEALVRGHIDAISSHDLTAVTENWHEDGVEDMVPTGILRGRDAIVGHLADLFAAVPDLRVTTGRLVAGETQAAVEMRLSGTFNGASYQGLEPTGKPIELRAFELFEIEQGKITTTTVYYDGMEFARQIGMLPPQDSGAEQAMKNAFNAVTKIRRAVNQRRAG